MGYPLYFFFFDTVNEVCFVYKKKLQMHISDQIFDILHNQYFSLYGIRNKISKRRKEIKVRL